MIDCRDWGSYQRAEEAELEIAYAVLHHSGSKLGTQMCLSIRMPLAMLSPILRSKHWPPTLTSKRESPTQGSFSGRAQAIPLTKVAKFPVSIGHALTAVIDCCHTRSR